MLGSLRPLRRSDVPMVLVPLLLPALPPEKGFLPSLSFCVPCLSFCVPCSGKGHSLTLKTPFR